MKNIDYIVNAKEGQGAYHFNFHLNSSSLSYQFINSNNEILINGYFIISSLLLPSGRLYEEA